MSDKIKDHVAKQQAEYAEFLKKEALRQGRIKDLFGQPYETVGFDELKLLAPEKQTDPTPYPALGLKIGELVQTKNRVYGDSFHKSGNILKELYPNGVGPEQYTDMLCITRVLDKLFRIATDKDALGESPWRDICGYALLAAERSEKK